MLYNNPNIQNHRQWIQGGMIMKKPLLAVIALMIGLPAAHAAANYEPVTAEQQSVGENQTLTETQGRVSVAVRYVPVPEKTIVFHPNGGGNISETFSPYAFKNVVNTRVFHVTIANNDSRILGATQARVQVTLDGLPQEAMSRDQIGEMWRKYHYLNTNTITGAPNFMEQERAIVAEHFVHQHHFRPGDVPPGGEISGYIAIPASVDPSSVRVRVFNLGDQMTPMAFQFRFQAKG